ncbi:hypothetical protein Micbo1qcDRAFT_177704 [Microdochium bolleyi]|uniref:Peptidoglycan binding-like domain-containing protein n=1 Tax=Microdochium bolleyi TaxID=196109 RepID=A0A136IUV6_9PEZI|nr:hypothetical protein Micbo1qcDRAFT_177704 [Microdochium bolleyi]
MTGINLSLATPWLATTPYLRLKPSPLHVTGASSSAESPQSRRSGIEILSGLPRSLLDVFTTIDDNAIERAFLDWPGEEAFRTAGILCDSSYYGYGLDADEKFGDKTIAALQRAQRKHEADDDGMYWPETRTKIAWNVLKSAWRSGVWFGTARYNLKSYNCVFRAESRFLTIIPAGT